MHRCGLSPISSLMSDSANRQTDKGIVTKDLLYFIIPRSLSTARGQGMDNVFFFYCIVSIYINPARGMCKVWCICQLDWVTKYDGLYTVQCMGIDTRPARVMSVWICSGAGSNLKVEGHKMQAPKNFDVPLHLVPFQVRLQARIRPRDESLPSSLTIAVLLIFLTTQTGLACIMKKTWRGAKRRNPCSTGAVTDERWRFKW